MKTWSLLLGTLVPVQGGERFWMCVFGPDRLGNLSEDVVSEIEAFMCENCTCRPMPIECLLGPDSEGRFYRTGTSWEYAAQCEKEKCVCSTHTQFLATAEERINGAVTFVKQLQEEVKEIDAQAKKTREMAQQLLNQTKQLWVTLEDKAVKDVDLKILQQKAREVETEAVHSLNSLNIKDANLQETKQLIYRGFGVMRFIMDPKNKTIQML